MVLLKRQYDKLHLRINESKSAVKRGVSEKALATFKRLRAQAAAQEHRAGQAMAPA